MERLAHFLDQHKTAILDAWRERARQLPAAKDLSRAALEDHLPQILDALAQAVLHHDTSTDTLHEVSQIHGAQRLAEDYDLRQVVTEYRILRRVIHTEYHAHGSDGADPSPDPLRAIAVLDENIDHAITDAVEQFYLERMKAAEWAMRVLGHDLRNPLNVTALNAQLLLRHEPPLDANARELAATIARTTKGMDRLVADLLDVARWRGGRRIPLDRQRVDLALLLEAVLIEFRLAHPGREFQLHAPPGCEGDWDADRVQQMLGNLLSNAVKYGTDPIRCSLSCEEQRARVSVCNGGRIAEEMRAQLFRPFHTSDPQRGTGLGLFISREIARTHGGDIALAEPDEDATCFLLTLPRHHAPERG